MRKLTQLFRGRGQESETAAPTLINAYSTLLTPPPSPWTLSQRDHSDPELAPHLDGFVNYVLGTKEQMDATLYGVMRHLQRVQHHFSLLVPNAERSSFADWASRANAVCFYPDGSVRDPAGRVLVSPDQAQLDPQAQVPFPADALDRRQRSQAQLAQLGIRVPTSLPCVMAEGEVVLRAALEVAQRTVALAGVAVLAETRRDGDPLSPAQLEENLPQLLDFLSPDERAYLNQSDAGEAQHRTFGWRYESLNLLNWALGLSNELAFPAQICDVPLTMQRAVRTALDVATPELRPTAQLLDALDLHYRLHWAVRDAQLKHRDVPGGLEPGVVFERHYALNWLICFENAAWDEVDTPT
jgi:Domain of unknown function (DUF4272)